MLPAHLAENIRQQVMYYLESTFWFRDPEVNEAFKRFLLDEEQGIFKGPWVQLRLPFRPAPAGPALPFDIPVPFHPHMHQWKAWLRLASRSQKPESTIITTGTGSGKTECFLYPILDHCLREKRQGRKGIKAIILYPMNALASDQEKRFAQTIWNTPALKAAALRVGTYTGRYDLSGSGSRDEGTMAMGPDHGITRHGVLQQDPPDVLLTNYRMLDFLLMRPQDQNLWRHNQPGVLRYLVLDELHTYDGAQGSDVACLIRRLKEHLDAPKGGLCAVGTSATLDNQSPKFDLGLGGDDAILDMMETPEERLARFASTLFEENITPDAVIGEDRLTVNEIIPLKVNDAPLPPPGECEPRYGEEALAYAKRQSVLWGGPEDKAPETGAPEAVQAAEETWAVELGNWLKGTRIFEYLLEYCQRAARERKDPIPWKDLCEQMSRAELGFGKYPHEEDRMKILRSFFALVAHAQEKRSGKCTPLIPSQVQLWVRELRRLGRVVSERPDFTWLDEPPPGKKCLPVFQCSECGESGWIGLYNPTTDSLIQGRGVQGFQLKDDPTAIYRGWFMGHEEKDLRIVVISPWDKSGRAPRDAAEAQMTFDGGPDYFCPASLVIRKGDGPCPLTDDPRRFRVRVNRDTKRNRYNNTVGDQGCPRCGSKVGVFIIGCQSATLSSVIIDEMFGSVLNKDPKLLAFTDSVQDASHRAGFFTARTFRFTFRTALQHVIDEAGETGLPLPEAGKRLLEYWSQARPGRPGSPRNAMASLMPPDLREYPDYLKFRDHKTLQHPPDSLLAEVVTRLTWEATSEFGVMLTHGRTLELTGSSCVGWEERVITETVARLREKLPGIDSRLASVDPAALRLWILGYLHRYRERGALYHPYLDSYARKNHWGKTPFGKAIPGRETYPPLTRYRPSLLVTQPQAEHEFILASSARSRQPPWHIVWARRALRQPQADETALLDLIRALLEIGTTAGLFKKVHQEGAKAYFAIEAGAAVLSSQVQHWVCGESGRSLVRPLAESEYWTGAPSLDYYAAEGTYRLQAFTPRQQYYQDRYRKGALRRVTAFEHTGLLKTEEREELERNFKKKYAVADDPNILTCTSTLEMGIDIGDLSSTMLCAIPPSTANYLQRIGRAGRATGSALIISVVNQRPHDLFFYARPLEMLKGRVDPPGCWLDASAVLVRQYLGYCFDRAVKAGELQVLPRNGKQLIEDLNQPHGHLPRMMEWVTRQETELRNQFLSRFEDALRADTRERFGEETQTDLLTQRLHQAALDFDRMFKDLLNSRSRLQDQFKNLDSEEHETRQEIEYELRLLQGRMQSLSRINALEILTDHGLLPNYAFPERGVRFYGVVYNKYRDRAEDENKPVEVVRPAQTALKELAPRNYFYTHHRQFEIQQLAIGNPQQPLLQKWAICGNCGHMRRVEELGQPGATLACPQCGFDRDDTSQMDQGQQKQFLEFAQSQAISYMEYYDSLSGDRDEERQRELYQVLTSFDQTGGGVAGAVGEDELPFGIEYRAAMILREINVGYHDEEATIPFGPDQQAPDRGFWVCKHCGVAGLPDKPMEAADHRRSCSARRRYDRLRQEGRTGSPFQYESVYLYRQLRSEAIRVLLPLADSADFETLRACIYLGLRLRFEGNPAHLLVFRQIMSDAASELKKYYLVLMDAVPGGTGYLKALYQEKDKKGREGEGIMDVLRRARDTLETCKCRRLILGTDQEDTDGCYRCIRAYHLQYDSSVISRERGLKLLNLLIEAGEKRVSKQSLDKIKVASLFGSALEKKFVDSLRDYVEQKQGKWEQTIIKGGRGYRFSIPGQDRYWDLELQPSLGPAQGVACPTQPDFLLRCDDDEVRPVAIFTDGYDYHCYPANRLEDDFKKRRAILESGNFRVWSITWEDLTTTNPDTPMVCQPVLVQQLEKYAGNAIARNHIVPSPRRITQNGFQQFLAFLECPHDRGWQSIAHFAAVWPLNMVGQDRSTGSPELIAALEGWRAGGGMAAINHSSGGDWIYNEKAGLTQDVITCITKENLVVNNHAQVIVLARLGDSEAEVSGSDYRERWRRFLAVMNLYQFGHTFCFFTSQEVQHHAAPELPIAGVTYDMKEWDGIRENTIASLRGYIPPMVKKGISEPQLEYYNERVDDEAFAEWAWPDRETPIALLVGDQEFFKDKWHSLGWQVATLSGLQSQGIDALIRFFESTN